MQHVSTVSSVSPCSTPVFESSSGVASPSFFSLSLLGKGAVECCVRFSCQLIFNKPTLFFLLMFFFFFFFSYAGYFNTNTTAGNNMFWWYFPPQNGNTSAPTVLWLQGGPGGSSLFGMMCEMGASSTRNVMRHQHCARQHNLAEAACYRVLLFSCLRSLPLILKNVLLFHAKKKTTVGVFFFFFKQQYVHSK